MHSWSHNWAVDAGKMHTWNTTRPRTLAKRTLGITTDADTRKMYTWSPAEQKCVSGHVWTAALSRSSFELFGCLHLQFICCPWALQLCRPYLRRFLLDFLFFTWRFVPPGREPAEVFRAYFLTWGIVRAAAFRPVYCPITSNKADFQYILSSKGDFHPILSSKGDFHSIVSSKGDFTLYIAA